MRQGRLRPPFLFATCDRRHGARASVVLDILATDQLEGADVSGVISEGGERLRVFLEGKTRATWRDHRRMPCGIHHTPQAKAKWVKRGPKIAPRDVVTAAVQAFARNEIDRGELMRRITPSQSR